jgi:CHAT domain-containing protein/Tfp pilus assembly protein PilF
VSATAGALAAFLFAGMQSTELVLDETVEGRVAAGASRDYTIFLDAGQYVALRLEHDAVPVSLSLQSPGGETLVSVGVNHPLRPERLAAVAEETGSHRIAISARGQGESEGKYRLSVDLLRDATPSDRIRARALRVVAETTELREKSDRESLEKARSLLEEALADWRAAGDRLDEAETLSFMGSVSYRLQEPREALRRHGEALSVYREIGFRLGEAEALNNLGTAYFAMGDLREASRNVEMAAPIRREIGDRTGEAASLNNLGSIHWAMGEPMEALEYYRAVLPLRRHLNDASGEARTLNNIGTVYEDLGESQLALEAYLESLPLRRSAGDRQGEATTLTNLGLLYERMGRFEEAFDYYEQSLRLSRADGNFAGEATAHRALAAAHRASGNPGEALRNAEIALGLFRKSGKRRDEALTVVLKAQALLDSDRAPEALSAGSSGLSLCRAASDRGCEAEALDVLASAHQALSDYETSGRLRGEALALREVLLDPGGEARTRLAIARAARSQGRLEEARDQSASALELIESERARIALAPMRATYLSVHRDAYELLIDVLMSLHERAPGAGYDRRALEASERARARAFLDLLAEATLDFQGGADPELVARERALRQKLNVLEANRWRALSRPAKDSEMRRLEEEIQAGLRELEQVQSRIRSSSPSDAERTSPSPVALEQIQDGVVDEGTLLLEYYLGVERSFLWAVDDGSFRSYVLPGRGEIESRARRVYDLLGRSYQRQVRRETELALEELSAMLVGPLGHLAAPRIAVVSDGALQFIPFAALSTDGAPLLARHEVVHLPSASVLSVVRRELVSRPRAPGALAVIADPVVEPSDPRVTSGASESDHERRSPGNGDLLRSAADTGLADIARLPFTRDEAEAILALAGEGSLRVLDFDASRTTVLSGDLSQYRLIHFAAHGLLNSRYPELSGLVLSLVDQSGQPVDGFLRLHEVYGLKLRADLVVLSACRTALGEEIEGEGLVGLVRGFMYAGAPRVVATLWDVRDESTAELMKRFYRGLLEEGLTASQALRKAQLSLAYHERFQAPYYWAGFVLQGEWR